MLSDRARKVLSVVWHTFGHEQADYVAGMHLICQRSRYTEQQVRDALNELVKTGYLHHKDGLTRVLWASPLDREKHEGRR
ncbi:hypothetical protein D3P07_11665 [Paenibacillus sp. 1011MAR3C5]|nr:hypothetical protein D3P07_11665 [Paenibacillus sp. 1011MAR3C5]